MKKPVLFVAIYVVLAGLLAARVPLGRAPDENGHIYYVQHLATTHTLPVFKPAGGNNNPGYEFHQPPLYYALCSAVWNMTGPGVQNYLCRVISMLFGAATICLIWGAAWRVFDETTAAYAAGFAALWPLHVNVGAFAGNDAASGFFCALMLYLIACGMGGGAPSVRLCVALGATCGLGMLTKSSALPVAIAAFGWTVHASLRASDRRVALRNGAIVAGVAALLCGPWLARNTVLYGDPLAMGVFGQAFPRSSPGPQIFFAMGQSFSTYRHALVLVMFATMWGAYGGPNTALEVLGPFRNGPVPEARDTFPLLFCCAAASAVAIVGLCRTRPFCQSEGARRTVLGWWIVVFVLVCLAWVNFNFTYFQGQARYLHPALLPMTIAAAYGWRTSVGKSRVGRVLTVGFVCVLLALTYLNAFGWRTLV